MEEIKFTIPLTPRSKKNSSQIIINQRTKRPMLIPSKVYRQYEKDAKPFIPELGIDYPVNIKYLCYMPTLRKCDGLNLYEALDDILVKYGAIKDDDFTIVVGHDGSRVRHDKENARTEVTITQMKDEVNHD